jgi:hypothetical protein
VLQCWSKRGFHIQRGEETPFRGVCQIDFPPRGCPNRNRHLNRWLKRIKITMMIKIGTMPGMMKIALSDSGVVLDWF